MGALLSAARIALFHDDYLSRAAAPAGSRQSSNAVSVSNNTGDASIAVDPQGASLGTVDVEADGDDVKASDNTSDSDPSVREDELLVPVPTVKVPNPIAVFPAVHAMVVVR